MGVVYVEREFTGPGFHFNVIAFVRRGSVPVIGGFVQITSGKEKTEPVIGITEIGPAHGFVALAVCALAELGAGADREFFGGFSGDDVDNPKHGVAAIER